MWSLPPPLPSSSLKKPLIFDLCFRLQGCGAVLQVVNYTRAWKAKRAREDNLCSSPHQAVQLWWGSVCLERGLPSDNLHKEAFLPKQVPPGLHSTRKTPFLKLSTVAALPDLEGHLSLLCYCLLLSSGTKENLVVPVGNSGLEPAASCKSSTRHSVNKNVYFHFSSRLLIYSKKVSTYSKTKAESLKSHYTETTTSDNPTHLSNL